MSLRRSLAWMTLSQGGFFLLQFGGSVILARLLTPYEMGVYAVAAAIIGVLTAIQDFGLVGFMVREHDLTPELVASTFTVNMILAVLLSAAVAGASTLGGEFLREPGVQRVMLALALLPLFGALQFLPATQLERSGKFKAIALISLVRMVCSTGVTVALALAGFSYMSIAYGNLAGGVVTLAGYNLVGRRHVSLRFSLADWRRIGRYGTHMLAISGTNGVFNRAGEFLLGRLLGLDALGLYSRASGLSGLLWNNVHAVIGRVVFVDLAETSRRGVSLRERYLRIVEIVTALLWPAFAGFAVLAGPLIRAVYGEKWLGAAWPLTMLSVASIVLVAITMTWEIFVLRHETGRQARFEVFRSAIGLVLFAAGCLVSLTAAAAARIAEAVFSVVLYRSHLERMTGTATRDFLPIYGRSLVLTMAAIGPSVILMASQRWSANTSISYVLAAIAAGVAAWLAVLWLLDRHPLAGEIRRVVAVRRRLPVGNAGAGDGL